MSAPADKQVEQITAIYPIIDGQQLTAAHSYPQSAPQKASPEEEPKRETTDVTGAGQNGEAAAVPAKSPDEIESMLSATSKPKEGPLIDFTQELKKDLPAGDGHQSKDT